MGVILGALLIRFHQPLTSTCSSSSQIPFFTHSITNLIQLNRCGLSGRDSSSVQSFSNHPPLITSQTTTVINFRQDDRHRDPHNATTKTMRRNPPKKGAGQLYRTSDWQRGSPFRCDIPNIVLYPLKREGHAQLHKGGVGCLIRNNIGTLNWRERLWKSPLEIKREKYRREG